ncbi:MAG: histidine phosphatase family protein [Planctomycetaceae bacterium]|nr:histidine phosphatase family protein [Planctomycetaceae bacterium]
MFLYIMRHADAGSGRDDAARALAATGRDEAKLMGGWLAKMGIAPTVVSSPYIRAMETAVLVAETLGGLDVTQDDRLASGMRPEDGAALVHEYGGGNGLLLVGHVPDVGELASHLLGAREPCVAMGKAAVACIQLERSGFGGGVLRWHLNPQLYY